KLQMTITYANIPDGILPVELTSFDGVVDGSDVVLAWETASETNNAGFEVQQLIGGGYQTLAFVSGYGTTNEAQAYSYRVTGVAAGTHSFRLKQVDFDGTFAYSDAVTVELALEGAFAFAPAAPNPFNPQTQFSLTVARQQHVRLAVYDMIGRQVALLHDGTLAAQEAHLFRFEASNLPSGRYFIQATGEVFSSTQTVVLMK
ncbi:MAG: T9SS type A sorting domain-containing protein, partial [Rhodothermales bacterium]